MPKRLVATVLSFLLVLQSVPLVAFAAEDTASTTPVIAPESTVSSSIAVSTTSSVTETSATTTIATTTNTASSTAVNSEEVTDEEDDTVDTTNDADLDLHKNLEGIVRQSSPYTCGPAALATLLSQLGDDTTEQDVLNFAPASQTDGVSLFALKQAAVQLGHAAVLKKWTPDQLAEYLKTSEDPVLIHDIKPNVGGHFSVVRDVKDGTVYLSDTEAGNITYSFDDFSKVFTGYALIADGDASHLLSDTSTNVSDEEAKIITGKYVPVALAAQNNGASKDAALFAQCMKDASSLTTAARRAKQTTCYQNLGAGLSTAALGTEATIAFQAGPSITGLDFAKDVQYSIDSDTFKKLDDEKTAANTAVTVAQATLKKAQAAVPPALATLQQAQTKQQQVLQANAVIQGKKTDYQNQLAGKQSTLAALTSQISTAKLQLGSITASISAASSNLGSLSKTMQAKLSNVQSQITSKQSTIRSLQQEMTTRQNTINSYNNQINTLRTTISQKQAKRQSVSSENSQLSTLLSRLATEQSALSRAQTNYYQAQNDIASLQQQLSSGSNQVNAEQAALNALKQNQSLAQQDLDRKQAELPRIQADIATLNQALARLTAPAVVPTVDYNPYNQAVNAQNQAQTNYNNAVTRYNQAVQAIQDEKNFIDAQEKSLDSKIEKEVVSRPVVAVVNAAQSGVLFIAGTSYQVVDSSLLNVLSNSAKLAGYDINSIKSLPFQVGRQTGNDTVLALSLLGIAGGSGTTAFGGAMVASGTGVCVATLAGGGTMLVPCAVTTAAGGATTLIGAGITTISVIANNTASGNKDGIAKAVEGAQNSGFIESAENGYTDLSKLPPVYRGGDNFDLDVSEFRFSATDPGSNKGLSLSTDALDMKKRFSKAREIISLPEGLAIKQRGKNLDHYEIVPTRDMTFGEFKKILELVKSKIYDR